MVVAGTRPEAIKLAPVIEGFNKLNMNFVFLWSGQHYDYEMSKIFFEELGLPQPDENLDVRSGEQAEQTAKIMLKLEEKIEKYKPNVVVAEGDTNTVVAAALTSIKKFTSFAHVEAGLRSWDRTMPEEINRIIAGSIAEIHFAPTKIAVINLMHEGIPLRKIHLVGNPIVDVVRKYHRISVKKSYELINKLGIEPSGYILVSVHRRENTNDLWRLSNIVKALIKLSEKHPVVFPVHPRTKLKLNKYNLWHKLKSSKKIILLEPLGYFQFLGLLSNSLIVLTDSGGVQEEAYVLKIPTLTLRYNTERVETVIAGINKIIGVFYSDVVKEALLTINNRDKIIRKVLKMPELLGDGKSGQKIAYILKKNLNQYRVESIDTRKSFITYKLLSLMENQNTDLEEHEIITLYNPYGEPTIELQNAHYAIVRKRTPVDLSSRRKN